MKRTIQYNTIHFLFCLTLVSLIFTCKMFHPDYDKASSNYTDNDTNVYFSPDGKSVTIYFEGKAPPSQNGRSLSRNIAMMATDYFEVVFINNGGNEITRANWEIGELASIQRPSPGNYASVSPAPAGTGSALLFAGRKYDKTLLALGKIAEVDNAPGAVITADTKSVTFEVVSLKAGLSVEELSSGVPLRYGFLTSARAGVPNSFSDVSRENTMFAPNFTVDSQTFPVFKFENWDSNKDPVINPVFHGEYTFGLDTSSSAVLSEYQNSIILAADGMVEKSDVPRSTANPAVQTPFILDNKTVVTMENNKTGLTQVFQNPVQFKFDLTGTEQGSVFTLVFQIPVYALSDQENPVLWHIRPAYGNNLYKLDDGNGGQGGAILFSTGNVEPYYDTNDYDFDVVELPSKWQYGSLDGWDFVVNGIVLELTPVGYPDHKKTVQWNDPSVRYTLGNGSLILTPGSDIPTNLFGLIQVSVQYILEGRAYAGKFYIWCVGNGAVDLKRGSPTIINVSAQGDVAITWPNYVSGTYIWLLQNTVNVTAPTWGLISLSNTGQPPNNVFILVMAANDGFYLERGNLAGYFHAQNNSVSNNLTMYFGGWPFPNDSADPVVTNTLKPLRNAKKYTINAANTGTNSAPLGGASPPLGNTLGYDGYMIEMASTPTPNIKVLINPNMKKDIDVLNEAFFAEGHVPGSR